MAPNLRVANAFHAMKDIGIHEDKVKPVLKRLLKLYDKNWELIEEENYRVLADAIFDDDDDSKDSSETNQRKENYGVEAEVHDETEQPLKRLRGQEGQASASPKSQAAPISPQNRSRQSSQVRHSYKGKEPMFPEVASKEKSLFVERPSHAVQIRDPIIDRGKQKMPGSQALIKPKDEPFTDDLPLDVLARYEAPIAVIQPDSSVRSRKPDDQDPAASHSEAEEDGGDSLAASSKEKRTYSELPAVEDGSPANLDIASSSLGEERLMNVTNVDVSKKSAAGSGLSNGSVDVHSVAEVSAHQNAKQLQPLSKDTYAGANGSVEFDKGHESRWPKANNSMVDPQHQLTSAEIRSHHDSDDIAKGEELDEISWLNEINKECPSFFNYIHENMIFQNAHVKFTLSQLKPENCCSTCIGDCLSSTTVCFCATEAGDKFAYTSEGLLRENFLEDCISMTRDPQQQCLSYCKACPFERSKNEVILEPCKGHLKRRYIKECWSKCSCHKLCGNRVVQRGIVHKLQVFYTPDGKGWGLRTLEKLPKGTFVCEYVGEILTSKELHERNLRQTRGTCNDRHTYPVLLDAYWFLKGAMKDEEALCLDATFYGNVARFINHRCLDANLIEIPIKMETPDHHYYHIAFFTTREVDAMEELTWDYGIDFNDSDHPVEVFECLCGSKFCRNMRRSNRSKYISR